MSACTEYLETARFKHISDVRAAFQLCATIGEIEIVIGEIPNKFGAFLYDLIDEDGNILDLDDEDKVATGFRITNIYSEDGNQYEDEEDYDFFD